MNSSKKTVGKVIKIGGLNVWPHEQVMADILAKAGYVVEFIKPNKRKYENTPDVLINGIRWEMKSPKSAKLEAIERNLKRGTKQCDRFIFYSKRMKRVPDKAIKRELIKQLKMSKKITAIKFIDRHGEVTDIA